MVNATISPNFVSWLLAGLALALVLGGRKVIQIRRIRKAHAAPISMLPSGGDVKVSGWACSPVIVCPVINVPCVAWHIVVEEISGKDIAHVLHQTSTEAFEVADTTGNILIIPERLSLMMTNDRHQRVRCSAAQLTAVPGFNPAGIYGILKAKIWWISPGDPVFVLGRLDQSSGTAQITSSSVDPVVVTNRSEKALLRRHYITIFGIIIGLLLWLLILL